MGWGPPAVVIYLIMVGIALIAILHVNGCVIFARSLYRDSIGKGLLWKPLHARIGWGLLLFALLLDSWSIYRLRADRAVTEIRSHEIHSGTQTLSLARAE